MPFELKNIALFVLLSVAAVLGNAVNLPLFFSVSMIFGSVFALMALRLLGLWPGVVIAAIGGSYTFFIWGHPYAAIIFTLEVLVVGLLLRREILMPIADLIYWLFVGAPLVLLSYYGQMGMPVEAAALIALKQPVNGIFNSVLAVIFLTFVSLYVPAFYAETRQGRSLSSLMFNIVLFLIIVAGTTPLIVDSRLIKQEQESFVADLLKVNAKGIIRELRESWPRDAKEVLTAQDIEDIRHNASKIVLTSDGIQFDLIGSDGKAIFSSAKSMAGASTGTVGNVRGDLFISQPVGDMPSMLRWRQSRYFVTMPLFDNSPYPKLVIAHKAESVVSKLDSVSARLLSVVAVLIFVSVIVVFLVSRQLTTPVRQLSKISRDIADTLIDEGGTSLQFPRSRVSEYDELSTGLETTSHRLHVAFAELTRMQASLEDQVRDRTRDLRQMSMVASQTVNGVIVTDRAGYTEWVNEAFTRISGYKLEDLLGRKPGEVLQGPDTDQNVVREIGEALRREEAFSCELLNYHKSGKPYWIEISCNPLRNEEGIIEGFIAIETDVSERRRLQTNKDEFISSVSHELRTPLTSINGSLTLLQKGVLGEIPEKAATVVGIASRNSDRLLALVNDILDVQQILSGRLNLDLTEIEVKSLLAEAIESNRPFALQHHISLICEPIDDDLCLLGDDRRLNQVLTNLISNSVKFSPEGTRVSLAAERNDRFVRISVADEGPGISEAFRSQIFGRFAQADSSDTKEKAGTGLGLNISRGIVEEHGGSIDFECPPEGGTRFYFDISLT